jgi:uncharacterized repeat protein (TIGR01451 family)
VTGAIATTAPSALGIMPSDVAGAYGSYVAATAVSYTVTWDRPGYGALPATVFTGSTDARLDVVLPPADNMAQDWGFEHGAFASAWAVGGVFTPTVARLASHTGNAGVVLGARQRLLTTPLDLSQSPALSETPCMALDHTGVLHVIWRDQGSGIFYSRRGSNGIWSSGEYVAGSVGWSPALPQVAVDDTGVVHAVWHAEDAPTGEILYAQRSASGVWSAPVNISSTPDGWSTRPLIAMDGSGGIHVIWMDDTPRPDGFRPNQVYYTHRGGDETWSAAQNISHVPCCEAVNAQLGAEADGTVHVVWRVGGHVYYTRRGLDAAWSAPLSISGDDYSVFPKMVLDGQGVVHVVWSSVTHLYYTRRASDGTWSIPELVSDVLSLDDDDGHIGLAVSHDGAVHVVWNGGLDIFSPTDIYYVRRDVHGGWLPEHNLSESPGPSYSPNLAVDDSGMAHATWREISGDVGIFYAREFGGSWTHPFLVSATPGTTRVPQLVVGPNGVAYLAWDDVGSGSAQILFAQTVLVEQSGDSVLTQAVALPPSMGAPTLSFFYQFDRAWAASEGELVVRLYDGLTTTAILSTTVTTANWTHHWFDLSPWSGQTVTLTFNVHQQAGGPGAWAYLDEVTVGSGAHPDLWTAARIQVAAPGQAVTFTLTYGNRGEILARGVMLTATLPTGLTFVAADPLPGVSGSTVTWNLGDLLAGTGPRAVTLVAAVNAAATPGSILSRVVEIASVTSETETANNTAGLEVYVGGARRYLPLAGSQ